MDQRFPVQDQIDLFATALRGRVIQSNHAEFAKMREVAMANFDTAPLAIVRVACAADVAATVTFARATGLPLAVRCGGHSTVGHSGCEAGLVIDLRDLNSIDVDTEGRTVWAGAGLTAGQVTAAVEPHGFAVGFGDSATVGIGGLTLGGGIGYLVRKHGLTIDSLLAAEVVTASGDTLIVDEANHPDLFWALRGGGGNFGVVTRFKFRLHALPEFVGGPLILPAEPEILARLVSTCAAAPDELTAIILVIPAPPLPFLPPALHGQTIILAMLAYAGGAASAQAALAPVRAIATPIADLIRPAPFSSMYLPEDPTMRPAVAVRTCFMAGLSIEEAARGISAVRNSKAPMRVMQVRVLGGAASRVDTGATAFAHRNSQVMTAFLAMYGNPADKGQHEAWVDEAIAAMPDQGGAYVNFLGHESPDRLFAAYPRDTLARLRMVKRQYDPENLFCLNHNIKPAA